MAELIESIVKDIASLVTDEQARTILLESPTITDEIESAKCYIATQVLAEDRVNAAMAISNLDGQLNAIQLKYWTDLENSTLLIADYRPAVMGAAKDVLKTHADSLETFYEKARTGAYELESIMGLSEEDEIVRQNLAKLPESHAALVKILVRDNNSDTRSKVFYPPLQQEGGAEALMNVCWALAWENVISGVPEMITYRDNVPNIQDALQTLHDKFGMDIARMQAELASDKVYVQELRAAAYATLINERVLADELGVSIDDDGSVRKLEGEKAKDSEKRKESGTNEKQKEPSEKNWVDSIKETPSTVRWGFAGAVATTVGAIVTLVMGKEERDPETGEVTRERDATKTAVAAVAAALGIGTAIGIILHQRNKQNSSSIAR